MISIQKIHKHFGNQLLFENASAQINAGDRFALVGPNGAGKSTLFKMILGDCQVDEGSIQTKKYISMGYLPQETAPVSDAGVLAEAMSGCLNPDGRTEAKAKEILMGLGFKIADFERPVKTLSGGWAMRVVLARLLLENPDILLLDEPTNHLDISSIAWFQKYLTTGRSSVFVISHDRNFINKVCKGIISIENGALRFYNGNYEFFLREAAAARERLEAAYQQQQEEIKDLQDFIDRNRARLSTASRAQSAIKKLEKIELIKLPPDNKVVKIRFPQPTRTGLKALSLKNISKSYGDLKVYENLNFELERGQKIALVGENGAGKSTLLKLLADVIKPDGGERVLGFDVKAGYFSQHRAEMLDPEKTVLQEAMDNTRLNPELMVRTVLGTFLFSGDAVFKKTKYLSGGEKSRLALVKLLLDPPNVLLLDEPTTHLDLNSVDALIAALKAYQGAICVISHDVYFLNELCDNIVYVNKGNLSIYPGNYDYFLSRRQNTEAESLQSLPHTLPKKCPAHGKEQEKLIRLKEKERKKIEKELAETRLLIEKLTKELESPAIYADYERVKEISENLAAYTALAEQKEKLLPG